MPRGRFSPLGFGMYTLLIGCGLYVPPFDGLRQLVRVVIEPLDELFCFDSVYFNSALEGFKLEVTVVHAAGKTSF